MLKQFSELMLCALAALCLAVAADSKPQPKMIEPKPLGSVLEIKILRARSAALAAQAESAAWIAEAQKAMILRPEFQFRQTKEREANTALAAALEEARKASGAPKDCDFTTEGKWVRYEQQGPVACLIPEEKPDAAIKTEGAGNVKIEGKAAKK